MTPREPAPTDRYNCISIGDVGFIRWGQFNLLFHAGRPLGEQDLGTDVPYTFEELPIGESVFRDPLDPGSFNTDTVRKIKVNASASASVVLCVQPFELSSHS